MTTSRVLIIGATGRLGQNLVRASIESGRPTFALVRGSSFSNPEKSALLEEFTRAGVQLLKGSLEDVSSLVEAVGQVDAVICAVSSNQVEDQKLADQVKIIDAIKEAGNIKKFYPSEFGNDVDRTHAVEPAKSMFDLKVAIRRKTEEEGIPYTFVSSNCFAGYFLPTLAQLGATTIPREKVTIFGDGNNKAIFVKETDIGAYTIKTVDDPRTLNKIVYIRPPANIITFNELVALWEKKIGKSLEKTYLSEEEVLKLIAESPLPINVVLSINHSVFIKGDHTNFEIDPSASELYPDVKYTTVDEYLDQFV
ncbi:hypothetical protein QJS10_CPB14g00018 [Acorus calamus]|uniref:NmrA-like domain-containing protein n=1 Tax=Acorus calamus TaxID=4465 RepID=A0AAV9DC46_ACOCL|nr:hypothetical protein QJS10_CPB14g00018 [Acorus calamus]